MDYIETVDYLFSQLPVFQNIGAGAYKPGLDTALRLSAAFGDPHKALMCVHVAGTNGKGSTSHMLASVLAEAGYRVGLYTSPHIFDFRERIRVNGEKIPEKAVVDFVERYRAMGLDCSPSFFELTTILAFDYFRSQRVDVAVIEVGLGGRLDTTNIITPVLSVITNISIDHKAQLGSSLLEIAREKAGIIKQGVPVVFGEAQGEVRELFAQTARALKAPYIFAEDHPFARYLADGYYVFSIRPGQPPTAICALQGEFQERNINTVVTALNILKVSDDAIRRGLANVVANTGLMGRWTQVAESPTVICDTGHNIGAWQYIAPRLREMSTRSAVRAVIGFVSDKDVDPIFDLLPSAPEYYFVTPSVSRGRDSRTLLPLAQARGLRARAFDSVPEGLARALADSDPSDVVFVGGSNFVVADMPRHV